MNIDAFIQQYKNHPILFVGAGVSLRYIKNSYNWHDLLKVVSFELKNNEEYFLDLISQCRKNEKPDYAKIASILESEFTSVLQQDRNGKFKDTNDRFYELTKSGVNTTRFKIYISMILNNIEIKEEMSLELAELKKIGKNIGSIVTTNYDTFIENFLDFSPLIGNDILLSNPYGAVYKIHGCITSPDKIIITSEDYDHFHKKYELIRAQLLSLFIHNPIVFFGYSVSDENIKNLLKTIFTYVDSDSEQANKIKNNFLLVERDQESESVEITDHDIDIQDFATIRINKIKTNNFTAVYSALSNLSLPISAMDIKKVQNIVKEIYSGGDGQIKVMITEDLEELKNSDKILAIGSSKSIQYQYMTAIETINNYFKILDEENFQLLELIDKIRIQSNQYFPIFAFHKLNPSITKAEQLKRQQTQMLKDAIAHVSPSAQKNHKTVQEIIDDESIPQSLKAKSVLWSLMNDYLLIEEAEKLLKDFKNISDNKSEFRQILCAYDLKKYGGIEG